MTRSGCCNTGGPRLRYAGTNDELSTEKTSLLFLCLHETLRNVNIAYDSARYSLVPVLAIASRVPRPEGRRASSSKLEDCPMQIRISRGGYLGHGMVDAQSVTVVDADTVILPNVPLCAFGKSFMLVSQLLKQRLVSTF